MGGVCNMGSNVSPKKRWVVAICGIILMLLLGTVYGWSVFKKPLMESHGWSGIEVSMTFSIAIFFIGISAAFGGKFVDKAGARKVATVAAILFGIGTLLAGVADSIGSKWLLWLGYGLIGGIGNGLGYITPIAILVRWFPDKRGVITGLAVMGFGFGAAIMGQIVPLLIKQGMSISSIFYLFGAIFLVVLLIVAQKLSNPPQDWVAPKPKKTAQPSVSTPVDINTAIKMPQFYLLWLVLFINVTAGIALLSNLSPMAQSQVGLSAIAAGTMVLVGSIFNGLGRIFWAAISDKIGRKTVFLLILATQIPVFIILPSVTSVVAFAILACYILLCYGGGFATMPSFAADTFGSKNMGSIYGKILIAWGIAGAVGPNMMEYIKKSTDSFAVAFYIAAGMLAVGFILALLYRRPISVRA
jgi:OFA family oxalate/formate antiporter-like MFS transporter